MPDPRVDYACPIDGCSLVLHVALTTPIDHMLERHLDEAHPDISLAEIKQRIARTQAP